LRSVRIAVRVGIAVVVVAAGTWFGVELLFHARPALGLKVMGEGVSERLREEQVRNTNFVWVAALGFGEAVESFPFVAADAEELIDLIADARHTGNMGSLRSVVVVAFPSDLVLEVLWSSLVATPRDMMARRTDGTYRVCSLRRPVGS
jgi:hypothetical protein